ncbi:hypothetical protein DF164_31135 [Burkholderia stagnalis]|nr:hypothetical protein DF164_31135 [Burkholderia stagnalis]RQY64955.1 hypothetical protein DF110_30660 [Burkholderia stagnalis]
MRSALVAGFAFGVLDDLLTSTKLLVAGKLLAAGNLMRQVVEGIAIAVLCSTDAPLIIDQGKKTQTPARECYWERLAAHDPRTHGHRALKQLAWNADVLGVHGDGLNRLEALKAVYNTYSHTGPFAIAGRVAVGDGTAYVGGHFDPAKLDGYRQEIRLRLDLCRALPAFMRRMRASITPTTDANPVPTAAQPSDPHGR